MSEQQECCVQQKIPCRNLKMFYIFTGLMISVLIHFQTMGQWMLSALATVGMMVLLTIVCAALVKLYLYMPSIFHRSASSAG